MIDRVELPLRHQAEQVVELQRDHAARFEQDAKAGDEVVEVRHVGQHVIGHDQMRTPARGGQLAGHVRAEESHHGGDAPADRLFGDVGGRLDAQRVHPFRHQVLEQVAVVARDLDDAIPSVQVQTRGDHVGVGLRMPEQRRRIRREVLVVGTEDRFRIGEDLELHQTAGRTEERAKRIVRLDGDAARRGEGRRWPAASRRDRQRRAVTAPRRDGISRPRRPWPRSPARPEEIGVNLAGIDQVPQLVEAREAAGAGTCPGRATRARTARAAVRSPAAASIDT